MAQVPLQVGRAGAYHKAKEHGARVNFSSTDVAVAASATDEAGTTHEVDGQDLECVYVLTTDATAGQLTINVDHADVLAGTYTRMTDDAVMKLGENQEIPVDSLVLDMSVAANQGTILVTLNASARELSGGAFVSELKPAQRLSYTTDGSWNGTTISEIKLGMYKHIPSGQPE